MTTLNYEKAVEIFMDIFVRRIHNRAIEDIMSMLEKGPPGQEPPEQQIILHQWFLGLEEEDKVYIRKIIEEMAYRVLFSTLVVLDGVAGRPIKGELSDFALYLQIYEDEIQERNDLPQTRIRLNPSTATEDLHDILFFILKGQA